LKVDTLSNQDGGSRAGGREGASLLKLGVAALSKLAVILAYFTAWYIIYDLVNRYSSDPIRTVHLPPPYQAFPRIVQPDSAIIYVFGGALLPSLPFLYYRSWRRIGLVLCSYTLTSAIAFLCYLIWPVSMVRPIYRGDSLGEHLMLWVFSKDMPGNCFPSSHVFFATLGAIFVSSGDSSRATRAATWVLTTAVCISTVTSGQHYFMDIPGGVVAAVFGYTVARKLMPMTH
jgi:membrane-associated phospholipid phosphatase